MTDRLLRAREVLEKVGITRQWLYKLMQQGKFPRPIPIGIRRVRWKESDIERWIQEGGYVAKPKPKKRKGK
jgi:prophage regulatory protein